jgi:hypothetical protein
MVKPIVEASMAEKHDASFFVEAKVADDGLVGILNQEVEPEGWYSSFVYFDR